MTVAPGVEFFLLVVDPPEDVVVALHHTDSGSDLHSLGVFGNCNLVQDEAFALDFAVLAPVAAVPTDFVEVGLGPSLVVLVNIEAVDFLCEDRVGRSLVQVVHTHVDIHHSSVEDIVVPVPVASEAGWDAEEHFHMVTLYIRLPPVFHLHQTTFFQCFPFVP